MDTYQTNIMITALMYIVLGLGLNIVVGLAGLLDLGYVAFYAVGAYTYGLLNHHFGLGFWTVLPTGCGDGGFFRDSSGLSGTAAAGGLPGHRHPWFWRNHSPDSGKLERIFIRPQRHCAYFQAFPVRHSTVSFQLHHLFVFCDDRHGPVYHFCCQPAAEFPNRTCMDRLKRGRSGLSGHGNR